MKLQIVIVALAALLMPTDGALRQCAGASNNRYESTGFLTADFTIKACAASGGSIDPNKRGNQKCCNVPDARQGAFNNACNGQKAGDKFPGFKPLAQPC
ncbi:hypothetical protein PHYSODRAFT_493442 [Phytophthora sojae]|uniref:Phytotoxin PcF domain-containing protein n=1 Tax=Phytophthora sojae (strain P6497) TaxID=1094619 RepID=G4Z3E6_PHYSP|nr:hypothetical protein PHYSODRAFT_496559 [Phytophthora sojae]XP_009524231.1 hypothetical protein PHYSODRAFT_493442 [Phytophthora sojae]EGZ21509.1 hypothetical protein PHYSODRAFT_496559 [Phytophthora sojae]EGZ21514.1 hypothetical protein PHYSODRAFT_493442 [Phytophthora sojae]|eukprot:XP_009524226.1 hypothetical protein PHYSODRAFT_496559 [Phytophthora sojae]